MHIIIDAMGGDNAPGEIVRGAVLAQKEFGVDITLVGRQEAVEACLNENGVTLPHPHLRVRNAAEVVEMGEDPSTVLRRKKDSSMAIALYMLRDGEGDAVISAGSTGALLTGGTLIVKRIRGIRRAAMAPVMPNGRYGVVLIDCGANVECTPEYLLQFAYMGSFYSENVLGCPSPKVGLLNVGTEDSKGTPLQKQTHALLQEAAAAGRVNYVGNVEAKDYFGDRVDVLVADGFSGNVMLKTIEGTASFLMKKLKKAFLEGGVSAKLGALLVKGGIQDVRRSLDPNEVGGTPLLGISRPVIKAHGSSDARAIRSAVQQAIRCVEQDITGRIQANVEHMRLDVTESSEIRS